MSKEGVKKIHKKIEPFIAVQQFKMVVKSHYDIDVFLQYTLTTVIGSFYSVLFATFICQNNSSESSAIMADEVGEHLARDQRPFSHTLQRVLILMVFFLSLF